MKKLTLFTFLIVIVAVSFAQLDQNRIIYIGESKLVAGKAEIKIDNLPKEYIVILTPQAKCGQLFVSNKDSNGFCICESIVPGNKKSCSSFAYLVVIKEITQIVKEKTESTNIVKISKTNDDIKATKPEKSSN